MKSICVFCEREYLYLSDCKTIRNFIGVFDVHFDVLPTALAEKEAIEYAKENIDAVELEEFLQGVRYFYVDPGAVWGLNKLKEMVPPLIGGCLDEMLISIAKAFRVPEELTVPQELWEEWSQHHELYGREDRSRTFNLKGKSC